MSLLSIRSSLFKWFLLAGLIFLLDQWVKLIIIENISLYERVKINDFINITHQRNPGAAFSFLADAGGWQRWFLSTIAIAVCLYIHGAVRSLHIQSTRKVHTETNFGQIFGQVFDQIFCQGFEQKCK